MLDKNLPGISGLALCALLKTTDAYQHVPIVMLSADPNIEVEATTAEADAVLPKPFRLAEMRAMVARYAG